jgi:hypothetical protein
VPPKGFSFGCAIGEVSLDTTFHIGDLLGHGFMVYELKNENLPCEQSRSPAPKI